MKVVNTIFGVFGILLMIVSAMFVAMAIGDLIVGDPETKPPTLVGLIVLFGGAWFWGFHLARSSFGWQLPSLRFWRHRRSAADKEQTVLAYAASASGRVTVAEVAGQCQLTIEESKKILDRFAVNGAAEILVTEDGTMVYDFDILSPQEKARAQDVL
jgi:hypothetical protein